MEHVKRSVYWAIPAALAAAGLFWFGALRQGTNGAEPPHRQPAVPAAMAGAYAPPADADAVTPEVTFVELGSVGCIPCEQMKPVMKAVEEGYGGRVKVVFHDVRVEPKWAAQFGIQLIPTQVFLDAGGKEFFRHQGFFAKQEIDALLASRGITPTGGAR